VPTSRYNQADVGVIMRSLWRDEGAAPLWGVAGRLVSRHRCCRRAWYYKPPRADADPTRCAPGETAQPTALLGATSERRALQAGSSAARSTPSGWRPLEVVTPAANVMRAADRMIGTVHSDAPGAAKRFEVEVVAGAKRRASTA